MHFFFFFLSNATLRDILKKWRMSLSGKEVQNEQKRL